MRPGLLSALALVLAGGCGHSGGCTELGWYPGLTLSAGAADRAPFADGRYEVTLEAEGDLLRTRFTVRAGRGHCDEGYETASDGTCRLLARGSAAHDYDATLVMPGPTTSFIVNVFFIEGGEEAGPGHARLAVDRDGERVYARAFEPNYERRLPNGPGCGVAVTAHERLEIPLD